MFLRRRGKQILLLRSYRDGAGKIRQLCLARIRSRVGLQREWEELEAAEPELKGELRHLKDAAEELVARLPRDRESVNSKVLFHCQSLLGLLRDYEVQLPELSLLRDRIEEVQRLESSTLDGSFGREGFSTEEFVDDIPSYDCSGQFEDESLLRMTTKEGSLGIGDGDEREPAGSPLQQIALMRSLQSPHHRVFKANLFGLRASLQALESLGCLSEEHRLLALEQRVRIWPDLRGLTEYALALGRSGRTVECLEALYQLPGGDAWANLNRAAVFWHLDEPLLSLTCLLKGVAKEIHLLDALHQLQKGRQPSRQPGRQPEKGFPYWQKFGYLWDESGRDFLLRLYKEPLIKTQLKRIKEGVRMRTLLHSHFHHRLLHRISATQELPALQT